MGGVCQENKRAVQKTGKHGKAWHEQRTIEFNRITNLVEFEMGFLRGSSEG